MTTHDHPPRGSEPDSGPGVRLQRVLAAAGIAARRACERMIEDGRVEVNGKIVRTLPAFVDPSTDSIVVDGVTIPKARRRGSASAAAKSGKRLGVTDLGGRLLYIMLHKPQRVMATTGYDERKTIMDLLDHPGVKSPANPAGQRVFPVGRLDFHSAGMVLMTSDGEMANRLTHPRYGVRKTYEAVIKGDLDDGFVRDLEMGLNLKNARAAEELGKRARLDDASSRITVTISEKRANKTMLEIALPEAGKRPLDEMLREAGVPALRLTRVAVGPVRLHGIGPGQWRELDRTEIKALRQATGLEGRQHGGHVEEGGQAVIKPQAPVRIKRRVQPIDPPPRNTLRNAPFSAQPVAFPSPTHPAARPIPRPPAKPATRSAPSAPPAYKPPAKPAAAADPDFQYRPRFTRPSAGGNPEAETRGYPAPTRRQQNKPKGGPKV